METGVMLTVYIADAMEVMKLAIDASKRAKGCQEMSDNAENAESE